MANKRTNPDSLLNIRRIDGARTHGYQVHIVRQHDEHTKLFSDNVFLSRARAKEAAIIYRDTMYDKLPPSFTELGIKSTSKSNTGHTGITFTFDRSKGKTKKKIPCFSVSGFPEKGKIKVRRVYLGKKTYEEAIIDAIKLRNELTKQREDKIEKSKS